MALLEASGIGKNFGETKVLKDISLTLNRVRRWPSSARPVPARPPCCAA